MKKVLLLVFLIIIGIINVARAETTDEGIILGPFIFQPYFSLVFEHTDNLFLQPNRGFSDNLWIIRPEIKLIYPFLESSVQFSYVPIWREYQKYELEHKFSHFFVFQGNIMQSSGLNIRIIDRFTRGYLEVSEIEPQKEVVWGTNRFNKNYINANATYDISERININIDGDFNYVKFIDREQPLFFFDYKTLSLGGSVGYRTSPLTNISIIYKYYHNDAERIYDTRDFDAHQFSLGMISDATPRLKGGFKIGFERKELKNLNKNINNLIVAADLTYELADFTRLMLNVNRGTYQSAYIDAAYFKATGLSLSLTHQFTDRFNATGGGYFQRNDYPESPSQNNFKRTDDMYGLNAELGYIISNIAVVHFNYKYEKRDSNEPRMNFTQNRLVFDVILGW